MRDSPDASTTKALQDGVRRSLDASRLPEVQHPAVRFWRRHKWKIIGLALFGLLDYVLLSGGNFGKSP